MFTLNTQDRHGIVVVGDLPTSFKETGRVYGSEGLSPTLTTMQGGDKIPKITDSRTNSISKSPGSNEKRIRSSRNRRFNQFGKTKFSVSSW